VKHEVARDLRGAAGAGAARRGVAETPHLRWAAPGGEGNAGGADRPRGDPPSSSVRRLAAAVWRLRPPEEAPAAGQRDAASRVGLEVRARHSHPVLVR